ncbi:MAG: Ig-like domain-containing protein [Actinomycetota bacterium]
MLRVRKVSALALAMVVGVGLLPAQAAKTPRALISPPGQVKIVSVNARQNAVLGKKRFEDMYELTQALRNRPLAFNGGFRGGVGAPDVIGLQEIRTSNVEIFEHILRQRYPHRYRIIGAEDSAAPMIYNPDTVTPVGEVTSWEDVCLGDEASGGRTHRFYQVARFTENRTGAPFAVATFHMPKNFGGMRPNCYIDNIMMLRSQLEDEPGATFIMGDFNKRSVQTQLECDPDERSVPFQWYTLMTEPSEGREYADAVRRYNRLHGREMASHWTHEQQSRSATCDGATHFRRSRIDYIFASDAVVAEASADAPGWAGAKPGSRSSEHKYSDHRFVWGRFVLSGPPQPSQPEAARRRGGRVDLSWAPVPNATGYIVYRSIRRRDFDILARVDASITGYDDVFTEHGVTYRYKVAAIASNEGQGAESGASIVRVDKQGPHVTSVSPGRGATSVDRRADIRVTFNQNVRADSVTRDSIRLFRGRRRVSGKVIRRSDRVLVFDPSSPLRARREHRVMVKPVRDRIGNVGAGVRWTFTVEGRKRKKKD